MISLLMKVHLFGTYRKICMFLINHVFTGVSTVSCVAKRNLLRMQGFKVGEGTTIVGPISIMGTIEIGENCWINRGVVIHGNGHVIIGNNCDIAPDVMFITGGHKIGDTGRRAGKGESYIINVGDGCWIGARSSIVRNITIGNSSVVAACSCVVKDVPSNSLVAGVPAAIIRGLGENG